jgi:hypothetical protein
VGGGVAHKDRTAAEGIRERSENEKRPDEERRKKIEEEDHSKKERLVIENENADGRLARIVKHREETAAVARTLTSENAVKAMKKFEEWKAVEEKKRKAADEGLAKREQKVQKVREDQKKQNLLGIIEARLKQDERDVNAKHIENLKAR